MSMTQYQRSDEPCMNDVEKAITKANAIKVELAHTPAHVRASWVEDTANSVLEGTAPS